MIGIKIKIRILSEADASHGLGHDAEAGLEDEHDGLDGEFDGEDGLGDEVVAAAGSRSDFRSSSSSRSRSKSCVFSNSQPMRISSALMIFSTTSASLLRHNE